MLKVTDDLIGEGSVPDLETLLKWGEEFDTTSARVFSTRYKKGDIYGGKDE